MEKHLYRSSKQKGTNVEVKLQNVLKKARKKHNQKIKIFELNSLTFHYSICYISRSYILIIQYFNSL
jgi:hypothetical protein